MSILNAWQDFHAELLDEEYDYDEEYPHDCE